VFELNGQTGRNHSDESNLFFFFLMFPKFEFPKDAILICTALFEEIQKIVSNSFETAELSSSFFTLRDFCNCGHFLHGEFFFYSLN